MSAVRDDPGNYFQTTDSIATTQRKAAKASNKHGDPIKLPSKILAVQQDPYDADCVLVAEAAGEVKRVNIKTKAITRTSNHGPAPLTCTAICPITKTLFSGCWDKNIYMTPLTSTTTTKPTRLSTHHTDFIKTLLTTTLGSHPILLSGGADSTLIIWSLLSHKPLHKIKVPQAKAIQSLAIDPLSLPSSTSPSSCPSDEEASFTLFLSTSDRAIRQYHISLRTAHELASSVSDPILAHETSIYKLALTPDAEGLWTASADKTAKQLVRSRDWEADTVLQHPDFVRDVLFVEHLGLVVTACRDEEVRVWDAGEGKLLCTYSGHFEEVTSLVGVEGGRAVVSVSIDGTVRRWGLEGRAMEEYREMLAKEAKGLDGEEDGEKKKGSVLTAEEEAELAELMDSDDE